MRQGVGGWGVGWSRNDFKFGTFSGRFPSDGARNTEYGIRKFYSIRP